MTVYTCCICGEVISPQTIANRRYSSPSRPMPPSERMVCNWNCEIERRRQSGQYQKMSKLGNATMKAQGTYQSQQRVAKIAQSNKDKPRRKKRDAKH